MSKYINKNMERPIYKDHIPKNTKDKDYGVFIKNEKETRDRNKNQYYTPIKDWNRRYYRNRFEEAPVKPHMVTQLNIRPNVVQKDYDQKYLAYKWIKKQNQALC